MSNGPPGMGAERKRDRQAMASKNLLLPLGGPVVTATWTTRPLKQCGELHSGGTPSKADESLWDGDIPWFSSKEVRAFELSDSELHVSTAATRQGSSLVPPGTVLFVVRGMSLANEFRVGVTTRAATFNQDVKALVPAPDVDGRYLARCLRWLEPKVLESTESSTHGTKRLPAGAFESLPIPLPPLDEQRRIADILDKADAIRQKRKAAIALTEELLRSAFLEMFGDPVTNPRGWEVKPLGDLAEIRGGGTPSRGRADYFDGLIPWATAKDFKSDFMFDTEEHVSEEAVASSATQIVPAGAILVVVKSKILMRRLPVAVTQVPLCFNQDVKGLIPYERAESAYVATHLRLAQQRLLELARGLNTEGLTTGHLRTHAVMRPPLQMRKAFGAIELSTREILKRGAYAFQEVERLFGSLVTRAFSGLLNTTDRSCLQPSGSKILKDSRLVDISNSPP
jgi:type I restriction enzyme, S subunit